MVSLTLKLVYDGLGATHHRMPTSLEKQVTAGAQEFLGAHAYFFVGGRIPTNVGDHSKYFHVHDLRKREGSWEALFTIDLADVASEFVTEYVRELTKNLAVDAALATKVGFIYLIHRSYRAWTERRPMIDRTFDRIEPVLSDFGGNGAPIFDAEFEHDSQRRKLYDRTHSSMSKLTAPIGRAAEHVDIWFDHDRLDRLEHRVYLEDDIIAALIPLKEQTGRRQRH